jgi:protein-tyrosine phosphatase
VEPVAVWGGVSPHALRPLELVAKDGDHHLLGDPDPLDRYTFRVELSDGRTIQTVERVLSMEGADNFRDLGGYRTADGGRVAWGRVFRSGLLDALTAQDIAVIKQLGIGLIIDLRSYAEMEERADIVPEGVEYRHMPVYAAGPIGPLHVLLTRHRLDDLFKRLYRHSIIVEGAPVFGDLLRLIMDAGNLPLLIHCTAGKDRTGIAAALLLHICGVPRETIVADYSLTNLFARDFIAGIRDAFSGVRRPPGIRVEQLHPLISARPALIEHALEFIDDEFGSLDQYLRGPVGLTDEEMESIRCNMLVTNS